MNLFSKSNPLMALLLRSLLRLSIACALLAMVPTFEGRALAQQPAATQDDPVRATLAQFGNFVAHPKYGEVWTPTVTPQDWHPYAPCNWVNSKVGWYYNDTTPWGAIVHHYGRWAHDDQMGWIWIPGAEFSPGWVVWRSDRQWIGWAPMPPDEEMQTVSSDSFNKGDSWIFQDIPTFERGCTGPARVAPRDHIAPLLIATTFVTEIEIIDGIAIYVLPPFIGGPVIDIDFNFQPWSPAFFAQVLIDWNFVWNNLNAPGAPCPPGGPGAGPQAGGGQQAGGGNPPPGGGGQQGGGNPPPGGGFQTCPDGSLLPLNAQCPAKALASCFNGLLPPSLCQGFPIVCGPGQAPVGNTCKIVCTPPAIPISDGSSCVTPDPPTKVAGGGCNGPDGAYAGCSGAGGPGGGGAPSSAGGCAAGSTLDNVSGTCKSDSAGSAVNDQNCDMKITGAKVCVANNVTCGAPGLPPCSSGTQPPFKCSDGTWQHSCPFVKNAGGPPSGGGAPPGGGAPQGSVALDNNGCADGTTLDKFGNCWLNVPSPPNAVICDTKFTKETAANICVGKEINCGVPALPKCSSGTPLPYHCNDGSWRNNCTLAGGVWGTGCGPGKKPQGFLCVADAANQQGPPASGCGESTTLGQNGFCKGNPGTRTISDQSCDMKITSAKVCVANDVTCGAPGELPCGPGQKLPVLCWDGTYRFSCPSVNVSATDCGPLGHWAGSAAGGCVVNVTCTPPAITSPDGTQCLDTYADVHSRPHPTSSPSPTGFTTIVAPTCCAMVHPSYTLPIVVTGTPTPRVPNGATTGTPAPWPTTAATGTPRVGIAATGTPIPAPTATYRPNIAVTATPIPTPTSTYRPIITATGTPTPIATYRPVPRETLPPTALEKTGVIGRAPSHPIEVISHGGGGQNTYVAKPITTNTTTTNTRTSFVSNTTAQPYRAPPAVIAHPMPAAAFARPATPIKKP